VTRQNHSGTPQAQGIVKRQSHKGDGGQQELDSLMLESQKKEYQEVD
jgi:hypothetical protein